jgi:hypothetical protein
MHVQETLPSLRRLRFPLTSYRSGSGDVQLLFLYYGLSFLLIKYIYSLIYYCTWRCYFIEATFRTAQKARSGYVYNKSQH